MKKKLLRLSAEEDGKVTQAGMSDPTSRPLTDKQWEKAKTALRRGPGRPIGSGTKQQVTLRIDTETLNFYKSKGEGWQTFINQVLGEVKKESKSIVQLQKKLQGERLLKANSKISA